MLFCSQNRSFTFPFSSNTHTYTILSTLMHSSFRIEQYAIPDTERGLHNVKIDFLSNVHPICFNMIKRRFLSRRWMINIKVSFSIFNFVIYESTQEEYLWFYRELLILLTEVEHQWNRFKENSLKTTNTLKFIKISTENKKLKWPFMNKIGYYKKCPPMENLNALQCNRMIVILW